MYGPKYLFWELQKPRSKHSSTWVVFLGLGWEWEEEWNMRARFWLFRGLPSFCFPWFAILMGSQNTWDATEHNILCDPARWGGFSSVAQSCLTLRPHGLQHAGPHCPSPTPGVYSLMSIELAIPSNHLCCPLLLMPSIFPSTRVFSNESVLHIRWPKYWSFRFSISPSNDIQDWFQDWYSGWTGWVPLQSKGLSKVFSNTTVQKHQFFGTQLCL